MVEWAGIRTSDGKPLRFGFTEFLPIGLLSFMVILMIGIFAAFGIVIRAGRPGLG